MTEERHALTHRYRVWLARTLAVLQRHDPMGIADVASDEYEPEAVRLVSRLQRVKGLAQATDVVRSVFAEQFSARDVGKQRALYEAIAADVLDAMGRPIEEGQ